MKPERGVSGAGPGTGNGRDRTERVLMWAFREEGGTALFGVLEDGTMFQRLPADGWRTVMGGGDADSSFEVVVLTAEAVEERGGRLVAGPSEFGFDRRSCDEIRGNRWSGTGDLLLVAFDMATKARSI